MSYRIMLLIGRAARSEPILVPPVVASLGVVDVVSQEDFPARLEEGYSLVVADISRGADAVAALDDLRKRKSRVPVVVLSGAPDWREARRLLLAGAVDYLSKGLDQPELRHRLEAALALSRNRARTE